MKHMFMMSQEFMRDENLSVEAKSVLLLAATYSKKWLFRQKDVSKKVKISRNKYYSSVRELESRGYIEIIKCYDKSGQYLGNQWKIHKVFGVNPQNEQSNTYEVIVKNRESHDEIETECHTAISNNGESPKKNLASSPQKWSAKNSDSLKRTHISMINNSLSINSNISNIYIPMSKSEFDNSNPNYDFVDTCMDYTCVDYMRFTANSNNSHSTDKNHIESKISIDLAAKEDINDTMKSDFTPPPQVPTSPPTPIKADSGEQENNGPDNTNPDEGMTTKARNVFNAFVALAEKNKFVRKPRGFTEARKKRIIARINQFGYEDVLSIPELFDQSDFLSGRLQQTGKHKNWRPDIDWAMKETPCVNILEGKYESSSVSDNQVDDGEDEQLAYFQEAEEEFANHPYSKVMDMEKFRELKFGYPRRHYKELIESPALDLLSISIDEKEFSDIVEHYKKEGYRPDKSGNDQGNVAAYCILVEDKLIPKINANEPEWDGQFLLRTRFVSPARMTLDDMVFNTYFMRIRDRYGKDAIHSSTD